MFYDFQNLFENSFFLNKLIQIHDTVSDSEPTK